MSEPNPPLTPMLQQYYDLKARDPEALLLFRNGDFYELFGPDAERGRDLLGLNIAHRDKGPKATMAGFPHPALNTYLAKLVEAGVRVAVCEQLEDAGPGKKLIKRDIVRVVTAGTLTEDAFLDPKTTNYLAAIVEVRGKLGLAWVELSTGHFSLTGVSRTELVDEIARLNPAEVLVSEVCLEAPWARALRVGSTLAITPGRRGTSSPSRPGRRSTTSSGPRRWAGSGSTTTRPRSSPPAPWSPTSATPRRRRSATSPG